MRRRAFIASLLLTAVMRPTRAEQPGKVYRIGYLSFHAPERFRIDAFRQRLLEAGWAEGRNLIIEYRSAEGRPDRLPELAGELVRLNVDVIVAVPTVAALAAKHATQTIPIVFTHVSNPVGSGLIPNLSRPGGNVTGFTHINAGLTPKRLEFLKEAVPNLTRVAALWHPRGFDEATQRDMLQEAEAAAYALGMQLQLVVVQGPDDFDKAFTVITIERADALVVLPNPLFLTEHRRLVALAAMHRVPAIYFTREIAEAGGLMAYGADIVEMVSTAAWFVDKILRGTSPRDLPVMQSTKFELVINLRTAKALGLSVPATLLARADEVIE
jgi:putative tryptophan/tyrosine transport system substrate-binding protein